MATTTRALLRFVLIDNAGATIPGGKCFVAKYGTSTPISNPMYPTLTGGTALTQPLTAGPGGVIEAYVDSSPNGNLAVQGDVPGYVTLRYGPSVPTIYQANVAVDLAPCDVAPAISQQLAVNQPPPSSGFRRRWGTTPTPTRT